LKAAAAGGVKVGSMVGLNLFPATLGFVLALKSQVVEDFRKLFRRTT
jgi:hypothetical protein